MFQTYAKIRPKAANQQNPHQNFNVISEAATYINRKVI